MDKKEKLRILFILPEFYPTSGGGIITFYQNLIKALIHKDLDVTILIGSGVSCDLYEGDWEGCKVYSLRKNDIYKYKSNFLKFSVFPNIQAHLSAAWAMYDQAQLLGDFDIIECTDWGWGYIPWVINNKHKTIVQFHASIGEIFFKDPIEYKELEANISQAIELQTLPYVNKLISHGKDTKLSWERKLHRYVEYLLPIYSKVETKEGAMIGNAPHNFALVVGRVQYWKGPTILCKAYEILNDKAPHTLWIGRNSGFQNTDMSSFLTLNFPIIWNKKIINLNQIDAKLLAIYQKNANFIIIPSTWDVFNFTCVEAMSLGKIVICSSGAGASDIIVNGINGFVFENENAQDLACKIEEVSNLTLIERKNIGLEAQKTVQLKLNPHTLAEQRIQLYQSVLLEESNCEINCWVNDFLKPSNIPNNIEGVLNNIPLRKVIEHAFIRIRNKLIK